jgi:hypothetical protein
MAVAETILETTEYRVVLVQPNSRKILALGVTGGYRLPRARIQTWARPAEQFLKALRGTWGLHVLVLDILRAQEGSPSCAITELLVFRPRNNLSISVV